MSWFGTLSSILGAFLVALGVTFFGYSAFLLGAGAWLTVAWQRGDKSLALLNATFFVANLIGLYRSF